MPKALYKPDQRGGLRIKRKAVPVPEMVQRLNDIKTLELWQLWELGL